MKFVVWPYNEPNPPSNYVRYIKDSGVENLTSDVIFFNTNGRIIADKSTYTGDLNWDNLTSQVKRQIEKNLPIDVTPKNISIPSSGGRGETTPKWVSTGKKVTVSQKGKDGKMHKVSRTTYKNASKPGEVRIARQGTDGKRSYVKFKVAVDTPKKKAPTTKKASKGSR
jgi:hypothetical protein